MFSIQKILQKNYFLIKENFSYYKDYKCYFFKTNLRLGFKNLLVESNIKIVFKIIEHNLNNTKKFNNDKLIYFSVDQKNKNCLSLSTSIMPTKIEKVFFVLLFFKQAFLLKSFLKGRIYFFFKTGFVVILNGLVCFLPINNCSFVNFAIGETNLFFISFFNENNIKTVILSQKKIYRKIHNVLLKTASKLSVLKN